MTPQEVIERIGHSTAQAGMQVVRTQLYGVDSLVARTAEFRLRWMATKLHTFLVASPFAPGTANRSALDGFMSGAMQYAKANKGGLPVGFQTGIAVLVVAVTEQADAAAQEWAATPHGRQFGVIPFPVMVDAASHQLTRPQRMVIGGIYSGYLKDMVDRHVGGALQWRPAE